MSSQLGHTKRAASWNSECDRLLARALKAEAALRKIMDYEGFYATDKNPSIRAIKRIASEALSDDQVCAARGADGEGREIPPRLGKERKQSPGATGSTAPISNDAELGIAWWNNLTELARAEWLERANSPKPADAWAAFKAAGTNGEQS